MAPLHRVCVSAAAFIIINTIIKKKRKEKSRRRWWVKKFFRLRYEHGNKLFDDLSFEENNSNFIHIAEEDFNFLLNAVEPILIKKNTYMRDAITVKERLLVTLRYLATGDSFVSLQYLFRISKQSISCIIPEVCDALIEVLKEYIKMPSSEEEWLRISEEFERQWNFPHAIAAMDGKHIMLQAPFHSGTEFYNYKTFFSIVMLALVDANYNFLYVDVGSPGRISDGGVFKNTQLYRKLENQQLNIPPPQILQIPYAMKIPYFILADQAFELNNYTMKPFQGTPPSGSQERVFNYRLSRGRRVVENVFGIVSSVFRVLRKPIIMQPEKAKKIVLTVAYLHNFMRKRSATQPNYTPLGTFDEEINGEIIPGSWRHILEPNMQQPIRNTTRIPTGNRAKNIRLHLANHFVNNNSLPWQNNY